MVWSFLALVLLVFAGVLWAANRALVLFEVRAHSGRIVRARGRIPADLYNDLGDVFRQARATGRVTARMAGGRVKVGVAGGIDEPTAQRIRNVVGRFPTQRIRSAPRRSARDPR